MNDYVAIDGFYDLREFDIPKKDFMKLWGVQKFLYKVEQNRRKGFVHPQIKDVKNLSVKYQQALFQYPQINTPTP